jgi:hypothetical protein
MLNEEDDVKKTAGEISNEANSQILSHCVMALKQYIEERLKKGDDVYSKFEEKVKSLYKESKLHSNSYKAYVYLEFMQGEDLKNNARIFSRIDKVKSVKDESISYALHLRITSYGNGIASYEKGFIAKDCGRFAVGHDVGHAVLDLENLISDATIDDSQIKDKTDDNTAKHCEADFFSYILSDMRDFYLLDLDGELDLDMVLKSYNTKIIFELKKEIETEITQGTPIEEIIKKIKTRHSEIKNIFVKSKELYEKSSLRYTMSHPIIALNKKIKSELQSKFNDKLEKLRDKLLEKEKDGTNEIKIDEIIKIIMTEEDISKAEEKILKKEIKHKEIENLNKKIEDLTNKRPGINIHLISKESYNEELTIDCYKRKNENTEKDIYCFEIVINKFSQEDKNNICKEICKAIGFIYFSYEFIIEIVNKDYRFGGTIPQMLKHINNSRLSEEKLKNFANELHILREENFKIMCDKKSKETELKNRLASCAIKKPILKVCK